MKKRPDKERTNEEQAGERADLRTSMDAWGDMVLRLALCRMQRREDAEDVFQTVFLKLHEHTGLFTDEDHLKAWLLRVTINCCNSLHRRAKHARHVSLEDAEEAQLPLIIPLPTDFSELHIAIERLPERQRTALHLYYHEGYTSDEIAGIIQENPATVRSHLHRARQALRIHLGGSDERSRVPEHVPCASALSECV